MVLQIVPSVLKTLVLLANVIMVCASGAEPPVVNTPSGRLAGVRLSFENKFTDAFLGIPYAVPPLGDLRFRKPLPFPSWGNVRSASQYAPACSQLNFRIHYGVVLNNSLSSEDCLYLNIWKPSCARVDKCNSMLPVVVYVYGGAFQWGDTSMFYNDGLVFSSVNDVVFVSFNYRTGVFGFLTTGTKEAPGNLAFWDQLLALKWVQKHITAFGGDPGSVTLYGQSSGSMAVGVHVLSPLSRGLFKRCIFESGTPLSLFTLPTGEETSSFYDIAASTQCASPSQNISVMLNCLRQVKTEKILSALKGGRIINIISEDHPRNQYYIPTSGDDFLPIDPFVENAWRELGAKKLLIGRTSNEGTLMVRFLTQSVPQLQNLNDFDYRFFLNVVFSVMLNIPVSAARDIVSEYFSDYDVQHDNDTVYSIIGEVMGDVMFDCPNKYIAIQAAAQGVDVYMYEFAHRPSFSAWPKNFGVTHADDLPFLLGT
ncbi:acetylcholinesterase, putative, partial [Ixodes scapularis]